MQNPPVAAVLHLHRRIDATHRLERDGLAIGFCRGDGQALAGLDFVIDVDGEGFRAIQAWRLGGLSTLSVPMAPGISSDQRASDAPAADYEA